MNYYQHHIGDYDSDTAHLSWTEDMAYTRLLRLYYRSERPIPADIKEACRLVRAKARAECAAVAAMLKEFFTLQADGWHNKRADAEIAKAKESGEDSQARKENEKERQRRHRDRRKQLFSQLREQGVVPPFETSTEALQEMLRHPPVTRTATAIHKPIANSHKPKTKEKEGAFALPEWIPAEPWAAWLEVRRRIKAPNTDYALNCAVKDLERIRDAGDDPQAVLDKAVARGWRGLFPLNGNSSAAPDYSRILDE